MADRWWGRALCATADPELFFPDTRDDATPALALCLECSVQPECREHALALPERFGIWGGLTEVERAEIRQAAAAVELARLRAARRAGRAA